MLIALLGPHAFRHITPSSQFYFSGNKNITVLRRESRTEELKKFANW
jgi:hypothetical protein